MYFLASDQLCPVVDLGIRKGVILGPIVVRFFDPLVSRKRYDLGLLRPECFPTPLTGSSMIPRRDDERKMIENTSSIPSHRPRVFVCINFGPVLGIESIVNVTNLQARLVIQYVYSPGTHTGLCSTLVINATFGNVQI